MKSRSFSRRKRDGWSYFRLSWSGSGYCCCCCRRKCERGKDLVYEDCCCWARMVRRYKDQRRRIQGSDFFVVKVFKWWRCWDNRKKICSSRWTARLKTLYWRTRARLRCLPWDNKWRKGLITRNEWRNIWKTSGDPVRWHSAKAAMSHGSAHSSWMRTDGDKRRLKLECGVRELLIKSCEMMFSARQCFVFVRERKHRTRRSWCCKVFWRNLAEDWIRCNRGKAVEWRRPWKTPPRNVLTAAVRELAPKMSNRI